MNSMINVTGYATSRDYRRLAELMAEQSVVCIVDYMDCRDVAQTLFSKGCWQVSARGTGYVYARSVEEFVEGCGRVHLEWLVPTEISTDGNGMPNDSGGSTAGCSNPAPGEGKVLTAAPNDAKPEECPVPDREERAAANRGELVKSEGGRQKDEVTDGTTEGTEGKRPKSSGAFYRVHKGCWDGISEKEQGYGGRDE